MIAECEKTIYKGKSGFCIVGMKTDDESVPYNARNNYYSGGIHFTAVGVALPTVNGVRLDMNGSWEKSRYGMQFKVDTFSEILPTTIEGIEAYLASGIIKGIGKATAKAIVSKFGENTFDIMENEPEKLLNIRGISPKKLISIIDTYKASKNIQQLMTFLAPYGITAKKAEKIQTALGINAITIIKESPFKLCDIKGFGFKTVDAMARRICFKPDDELRIMSAVRYALDEAEINGHLFLNNEPLIKSAYDLLNENIDDKVDKLLITEALSVLIDTGELVLQEDRVYKQKNLAYEQKTAEKIAFMLRSKNREISGLDWEIQKSEKKLGITLSDRQRDAVKMCMNNKLSIVTGGPGTGKTTVLRVILDVYGRIKSGNEILLTAPTGKAARRMAESTGFNNAVTLHSALGLVSEDVKPLNELTSDFIIVDEFSMVDMTLAYHLFNGIGTSARLLLVGDAYQLPSVAAGNVLSELIKCGKIPITELDMLFRQKETGPIALNAHTIKNGGTGLVYNNDFRFIAADNQAEAAEITVAVFKDEVSEYGLDNVMVLSPFKVKGEAATSSLNERLRDSVNPVVNTKLTLEYGFKTFRINDKVIQTKNRDYVSNGEIGYIRNIVNDDEPVVTVEFSGGRRIDYKAEDLDILDLAYAITIHKSQGSESRCVILPLVSAFYVMLQRNLVYTAITRAKDRVIIIGEKKALFMAVHKNHSRIRNTALGERIVNALNNK